MSYQYCNYIFCTLPYSKTFLTNFFVTVSLFLRLDIEETIIQEKSLAYGALFLSWWDRSPSHQWCVLSYVEYLWLGGKFMFAILKLFYINIVFLAQSVQSTMHFLKVIYIFVVQHQVFLLGWYNWDAIELCCRYT